MDPVRSRPLTVIILDDGTRIVLDLQDARNEHGLELPYYTRRRLIFDQLEKRLRGHVAVGAPPRALPRRPGKREKRVNSLRVCNLVETKESHKVIGANATRSRFDADRHRQRPVHLSGYLLLRQSTRLSCPLELGAKSPPLHQGAVTVGHERSSRRCNANLTSRKLPAKRSGRQLHRRQLRYLKHARAVTM